MEELSIKVNIADRFFPLTVKKEEEEMVRMAAKLIQDKLRHLQQQFAVKDKQDMLSMVCLEVATELLRQKNIRDSEDISLFREIEHIQKLLQHVTI